MPPLYSVSRVAYRPCDQFLSRVYYLLFLLLAMFCLDSPICRFCLRVVVSFVVLSRISCMPERDIFYVSLLRRMARSTVMQAFRLRAKEKKFLDDILDKAAEHVQMQDRRKCHAYALHLLQADKNLLKLATATLRPCVLARLTTKGDTFLMRLLARHARYLSQPQVLRGKALDIKSSELGLVTRVTTVRVDVATLTEECTFAAARTKMNMEGEIGKACDRVVVQKLKRKECIKRILELAQRTGVADVTLVWREFSTSTKKMVDVALEAIAACSRLMNVYVLDIHEQTYLFPLPTFVHMLDLITESRIFAINMGEDNRMLQYAHFEALGARITDGSIPLRRWFVEDIPGRRSILITCKLVSKVHNKRKNANAQNPNAWTIARRRDKEMWVEGKRNCPRLAWLTAPKSAYVAAIKYKTAMQDRTCNWTAACALRNSAEAINAPA